MSSQGELGRFSGDASGFAGTTTELTRTARGTQMATVDISVSRMRTDDRWMDRAACRGLTYLFFPLTAERPQARQRREALARSICASCSVRADCREFARENHEYGLWGGESEDERHEAGFRLIAPIGIRANVG